MQAALKYPNKTQLRKAYDLKVGDRVCYSEYFRRSMQVDGVYQVPPHKLARSGVVVSLSRRGRNGGHAARVRWDGLRTPTQHLFVFLQKEDSDGM